MAAPVSVESDAGATVKPTLMKAVTSKCFHALLEMAEEMEMEKASAHQLVDFVVALTDAGVDTLRVLVEFLGDDIENAIRVALPEAPCVDGAVVAVIGAFLGDSEQKLNMERATSRRARDPGLSDSLVALERAKRARVEKEEKANFKEGAAEKTGIRGPRAWSHRGGPTSLGAVDEKAYAKWASKAIQLLVRGGVPSIPLADASADPEGARRGLLGGARAATLRLRVRTWATFVRWLEWQRGRAWPANVADVMDYILHTISETPSATFASVFLAGLGWFEARSGLLEDERYADNERVKLLLERARVDLNLHTAEVVRAPRFPISIIVALEVAVLDGAAPVGHRVLAWARLIKIFGVLRSDDIRRATRQDFQLGDAGLTGSLRQTKTTGAGKKVRHLTFFIPEEASFSGLPWLRRGFELWQEAVPQDVDHFLPRPAGDLSSFTRRVASTHDLAAMFRAALQGLLVPALGDAGWATTEEEFVNDSFAGTFTGHSERCSLPSLAATLGVPKAERDYLGRWSPSGSDEYIRSSKVVMRKTVEKLMEASVALEAYVTTDESESFESLGKRMVRNGKKVEDVDAMVVRIKERARKVFEDLKRAGEKKKAEKEMTQQEEETRTAVPQVAAPEVLDEAEEGSDRKAL